MNRKLQAKLEQFEKRRKVRRSRTAIAASLCAVVAVCVSYLLINPAATQQQEVYCGLEEHKEHDESCYEKKLVCQLSEEGHAHSEECYEEKQVLTCTLSETDGHIHSDACYGTEEYLSCELEETDGHRHGEECYETEHALVCGFTETTHEHTDECYETQQILTCECTDEAHEHTNECYTQEQVLICGITEETHEHTDECYEDKAVLICQIEECEPHHHDETCYSTRSVLICNEEEAEPHHHDDSCYANEKVCICSLEECEVHEHGEECYAVDCEHPTCGLQIHEHTLQCFSNPEADIEDESVWEGIVDRVELSGNWHEDVLNIAKTQLGYTESLANYQVQEDGTTIKGYTRYGAWYGDPYGDWNAMFCAFCLNYAGIDEKLVPQEKNCRYLVEKLSESENDLYRPVSHKDENEDKEERYVPVPGDLVFFDWDKADIAFTEDRQVDRVGIAAEIIYDETTNEVSQIKVIEGDCNGAVCFNSYEADDRNILGYGVIPENPSCSLRTIESQPAADGAVAVINGILPANAQAEIQAVSCPEESLIDYFGAEKAALMIEYAAYDIRITVNGEEWQPDQSVSVTVRHPELNLGDSENVGLAHVEEEANTVTDIDVRMDGNDEISFEANGFSVYIVYVFGSGEEEKAASSDKMYVIAASDFQDDLPQNVVTGNTRMDSLLNVVDQNFESDPVAFLFGGDYSRYPTNEAQAHTESRIQDLDKLVTERFGNIERVYIKGNHDYVSAPSLAAQGQHDTQYYGAFVIDYSTYPNGSESAQRALASQLDSYLAEKAEVNYRKPVFVLTHVPFHYSSRIKQDNGKYAKLFYDACYRYGDELNIIVLVGHNHSSTYDDYLGGASLFFTDGDLLPVPNEGTTSVFTKQPLNFTYMNYGYVGFYGAGSSSSSADRSPETMTVTTFEIEDDSVIVNRWNVNGRTLLKNAGTRTSTYGDYTGTVNSPYVLAAPAAPDPAVNSFTDPDTGISVSAVCSGLTVNDVTADVSAENIAEVYSAYEITLSDLDGSAEILIPVSDNIAYDSVWKLTDDGILESITDAVLADEMISFSTENLSGIYVVGKALTERAVEVVDQEHGISVSIAGVFPSDAAVELQYPGEDSNAIIRSYLENQFGPLGGRLFSVGMDIALHRNGSKLDLNGETVTVTVKGFNFGGKYGDDLYVRAYHLVNTDAADIDSSDSSEIETELLPARVDEDGSLIFETESFSVIYFTVDFQYLGKTFNLAGEKSMLLSELFTELDIDCETTQIESVEFSDNELLNVVPVYGENGTTVIDWNLVSLAPFATGESLCITLYNGQVITIGVTDAQMLTSVQNGDRVIIQSWQNPNYYLTDQSTGNNRLRLTTIRNEATVWTIESVGRNNTLVLKSGDFYLTVGDGTASLGSSNRPTPNYISAGGYWDISTNGRTSYHLNQFGGETSAEAGGYNVDAANDPGSRWNLLPPEPDQDTVKTMSGNNSSTVYTVNVYGIQTDSAGNPVSSEVPTLLGTVTVNSNTTSSNPVVPETAFNNFASTNASLTGADYVSAYFGTYNSIDRDNVTALYRYGTNGVRYLGIKYNGGSSTENQYISDSDPRGLYVKYTLPEPNTWQEGNNYKVKVYGIHVDDYGNVLSDTPILLDTVTIYPSMSAPTAIANPYSKNNNGQPNVAYLPSAQFLKYVDNGIVSGEYAGSYYGQFDDGERIYDTRIPDHSVQGESADGIPDGVDALFSSNANGRYYLGIRYQTKINNVQNNTIPQFIQGSSPEALYIMYTDKQVPNIQYDTDEGKAPDHRKYIDSFRDGDPNPDTQLDDTAADLTDLYRVYLDVGPETAYEPIDVLIMLDLSNSMESTKDATDLYGSTTSRLNALWGLLYGMRSKGDYTTNTLNVVTQANPGGKEGLLKSIIDMNPDNNIAVTFFSEKAENGIQVPGGGSGSTNLAEYHTEVIDWFKAGDWNQNMITRFMPPNGTNYTAAMIKMQDMLKEKADDGHKKVVIFVSDGEPNYFTYGYGGNFDEGVTGKLFPAGTSPIELSHFTNGYSTIYPKAFYDYVRYWSSSSTPSADGYEAAIGSITNFKGWMAKQGDIIFNTIAIGAAGYFFLDEMAFGGDSYGGNDFGKMLNVMKDMISQGAGQYTDIKVVDTISDDVVFYQSDGSKLISDPANADIKVYMMDKEGNKSVIYENNAKTAANSFVDNGETKEFLSSLTVTDSNTITATFQNVDTPLHNGLKFTISYNIKTKQEAYDKYAANVKNGGGTDDELNGYAGNKGEKNTDYADSVQQNTTSSEKPGWNANNTPESESGKAQLLYKQQRATDTGVSDWKTAYYDHPVVQVWTADLKITKNWSDGNENHADDSVTVDVLMKDMVSDPLNPVPVGPVTDPGIRTGGTKIAEVTLSAANNWTYILKDLPRGYYYYISEHVAADDEYRQSYAPYAYAVPHDAAGDVNFTLNVTNTTTTELKYLVLKKNDMSGKALSGAKFKLYSDAQHTTEVTGLITSGTDGVFTPAEFTLENGDYYLVETEAPPGYNRLEKDVCITVADEGITAEYDGTPLTITSVESTEGNETTITYTLPIANSSGYVLPETGGPGTALLYALGVMLMAFALMYGYRLRRRRERRDY